LNDEKIDSILNLLIGLKVILLGPDINIEKLPLECENFGIMNNMYVTLDCNSVMSLKASLGQPSTL